MKRPKIILTNDDGIHAPGIRVLWKTLSEMDIADLFIIAPATEKSGAGASISWDRPILIQDVEWPNNTPAWSVDGSPADCIKMAIYKILDQRPDFILSGINAGSNAGRNVLHSGTVGAVIEGIYRGIPGMALSCENGQNPNFSVAEKYVGAVLQYALENPLPPGCFLNVNFPHTVKDEVNGFRMTRQGKGRWIETPYLHLESIQGPIYWMGGKPEEITEDGECDITLLQQGFLTAVPVYVHDLTQYGELNARKIQFENFFKNYQL